MNALPPGYSKTPTYNSWHAMITRCYLPTVNCFRHYGGRGIKVCSRWRKSYASFLEDMGERPAGHVLDRIEVNGHYEPRNCRWISRADSARNTRRAPVGLRLGESSASRRLRTDRAWRDGNRERFQVKALRHYYRHRERINADRRTAGLKSRHIPRDSQRPQSYPLAMPERSMNMDNVARNAAP